MELTLLMPQLQALCKKYAVEKLSLFGSRARGDARPDSDYDFRVRFGDHPSFTMLHQFMDFYYELKELLGAEVHFLEEGPIRNVYLRESIEACNILVYEQAA